MYSTDSTSQVAQIKGITGLNVRCSAVEDESSRSTSPWGLWVVKLVRFLYLPVSRLYTAYRWLARSQWTCVNWGTNTIKNHKKRQKRQIRKTLKKMNGDFMLTLCWSFHCLKLWLLILIAQVSNVLEWCQSLFYIAKMIASFHLCCQSLTIGHLFIEDYCLWVDHLLLRNNWGTDHLAVDISELLIFELSLRFIFYLLALLWGLQTYAFISIKL